MVAAKEALAKERARLQKETRELTDDRRRLAESEAQLRQQEAMLQAANDRLAKDKDTLAKQLQELQIKQEAALQRLRAQVGSVIERFAAGRIDSQGLLTQLRGLGVELTDEADVPQLTATMHDDQSGYCVLYGHLSHVCVHNTTLLYIYTDPQSTHCPWNQHGVNRYAHVCARIVNRRNKTCTHLLYTAATGAGSTRAHACPCSHRGSAR